MINQYACTVNTYTENIHDIFVFQISHDRQKPIGNK
jgi:hypothetical protein